MYVYKILECLYKVLIEYFLDILSRYYNVDRTTEVDMAVVGEKVAKAICGTFNEVGSLGSYDNIPSFEKIPGVWFDIDPEQPNSIIISAAGGSYDKKTPRWRVTVEMIK